MRLRVATLTAWWAIALAGPSAYAVASAPQVTQGTARVVASDDAKLRSLSLRGVTQSHWRLGREMWRAEGVAVKVLRAEDWCELGRKSGEYVRAGGSNYDFLDSAFLAAYSGKLILSVDVRGGLPWCGLPLTESGMAVTWPEVVMCKYALGYVTVRPSKFLNGFYTHVQPGGWWTEYAPFVTNLSSCAVLDAYTTPEEFEYLDSLRRNASEREPSLVMDLELENNPYHVLFTSVAVIVLTHYAPGLLYLYVAFRAVSELRERRRLGIPTTPAITTVLCANAGMMLVLSPVIFVEGYFFSGHIPSLISIPLRPLLLGCGAASSTLVVHIWDTIVRAGSSSSNLPHCLARVPWRVGLAIVLVVLDAVCMAVMLLIAGSRNNALILVVPIFFLLVEVASVLTFLWKLLDLVRTVDSFVNLSDKTSDAAVAQLAFKTRTTRAALFGAICSLLVVSALLMIVRGWVYYDSPAGCLFVGCMFMYGKVGVAASHVKICSKPSRPRKLVSRTPSVQPSSTHKVVFASAEKREMGAPTAQAAPHSSAASSSAASSILAS